MKKILALSIAVICLAASPAFAGFGGMGKGGPAIRGDFKPVVGAWAEYEMKGMEGTPSKMKMGIVAKEGNGYWYETVSTTAHGKSVMKMLVSGDPNDQMNVKRMIMKQGNEQAIEMPVMKPGQQPSKTVDAKGKVVDKGMEKVTVPAGTYMARHYQYQYEKEVVDSWISEKLPPYGLVKSSSKNFEMVLVGSGTGAKTLITETPKKFEMPKMPAGMPKGMMPPGMPMGN